MKRHDVVFKDHRELCEEMELSMSLDVSPGAPVLLENGLIIYRELCLIMEEFLSEIGGFHEVRSPALLKASLWEQSGHLEKFSDDMFLFGEGVCQAGLKPMNCPVHMLIFNSKLRSYRELPYRIHDKGILHRNENSGALLGLARLNQFHQDDSHIFVAPEQLDAELQRCLEMIDRVYKSFGFNFRACVSSRPEKYLGDLALWDQAELSLQEALSQRSVPFSIDVGGGAFYGPKIGIEIEDSMGRWWQVATVQIDFNLPERFNLRYIDSDGKPKRPVVIHMALYGAIERFMACLLEHSQGHLPMRLAPQQVRIYPVADRHMEYAEKVRAALRMAGIRVVLIDDRDKLGARLREGRRFRAPYSAVVGDSECELQLVSVSGRGGDAKQVLPLDSFVERCKRERSFCIEP